MQVLAGHALMPSGKAMFAYPSGSSVIVKESTSGLSSLVGGSP